LSAGDKTALMPGGLKWEDISADGAWAAIPVALQIENPMEAAQLERVV
jgi:hypothetical protein